MSASSNSPGSAKAASAETERLRSSPCATAGAANGARLSHAVNAKTKRCQRTARGGPSGLLPFEPQPHRRADCAALVVERLVEHTAGRMALREDAFHRFGERAIRPANGLL